MDLKTAIRSRRSHREFLGKPLEEGFIRELLECATRAPNHKRNQPWRFQVVSAVRMAKFLEQFIPAAKTELGTDPKPEAMAKVEKLDANLRKIGGLVYVTSLRDEDEVRDWENYAATVCAVQNLLLLATEAGLGSFWSTGKAFSSRAAERVLSVDFRFQRFVGAIFIGEAADRPSPPEFDLGPRYRVWVNKA